ncbi:MAG: shikimate dehydrogenase [Hyphomonadaceae bacterium]|nr:MAG: shikimate dehydrogenase [Hyphomonadaceae bacterium]KAF0187167.1 MAG: shikimate dehydrogenase [Hyphomonadaceae bacterium]
MKITASTEIYGVMGNPIRHSLSPILQNGWLEEAGYNAVYLAFEPKMEQFTGALNGLALSQIKGLNVTAPFKNTAAELAVTKTEDVAIIGAANTLRLSPIGYDAHNTDGKGLALDLDNRAENWREQTKIITILGAGGAAKGILSALIAAGAKEIRFVGRDDAKCREIVELAKSLAKSEAIIIHSYGWEKMAQAIADADLIINATPIGQSHDNSLSLDFGKTAAKAIIYDMTYAQKESDLLKSAKAQNRMALNGIGMLVGQGAYAFEIWFGQLPDFTKGFERLINMDR